MNLIQKAVSWVRGKVDHFLMVSAGCLIALEILMPWFWDWLFGAILFGLFWLVLKRSK